jgi:hypothetical protein
MTRMHLYTEAEHAPCVDLRLPLDVARDVVSCLCHKANPADDNLDGVVVDELRAQICDQVK